MKTMETNNIRNSRGTARVSNYFKTSFATLVVCFTLLINFFTDHVNCGNVMGKCDGLIDNKSEASPIVIMSRFTDPGLEYPDVLTIRTGTNSYSMEETQFMEFIGFWVRITEDMVLPQAANDQTGSFIPSPETLGLKLVSKNYRKTYCPLDDSDIDPNRSGTNPIKFMVPDGTFWVYYTIVTKWDRNLQGGVVVDKIMRDAQVFRSFTKNEELWAKTKALQADYDYFKTKVPISKCM